MKVFVVFVTFFVTIAVAKPVRPFDFRNGASYNFPTFPFYNPFAGFPFYNPYTGFPGYSPNYYPQSYPQGPINPQDPNVSLTNQPQKPISPQAPNYTPSYAPNYPQVPNVPSTNYPQNPNVPNHSQNPNVPSTNYPQTPNLPNYSQTPNVPLTNYPQNPNVPSTNYPNYPNYAPSFPHGYPSYNFPQSYPNYGQSYPNNYFPNYPQYPGPSPNAPQGPQFFPFPQMPQMPAMPFIPPITIPNIPMPQIPPIVIPNIPMPIMPDFSSGNVNIQSSAGNVNINNGVIQCHGMTCPNGTVRCKTTEDAIGPTYEKIQTITQCFAQNNTELDKKQHESTNKYKGQNYHSSSEVDINGNMNSSDNMGNVNSFNIKNFQQQVKQAVMNPFFKRGNFAPSTNTNSVEETTVVPVAVQSLNDDSSNISQRMTPTVIGQSTK